MERFMGSESPNLGAPSDSHVAASETRRQFIERARAAAAIPAVIALSMTWTNEAKAS